MREMCVCVKQLFWQLWTVGMVAVYLGVTAVRGPRNCDERLWERGVGDGGEEGETPATSVRGFDTPTGHQILPAFLCRASGSHTLYSPVDADTDTASTMPFENATQQST
ncbi:hypothetical protein BaRGS_00010679, partial [Batillaria attramentaria]